MAKVYIQTNGDGFITLVHRRPDTLPTQMIQEGYVIEESDLPKPPAAPKGKMYRLRVENGKKGALNAKADLQTKWELEDEPQPENAEKFKALEDKLDIVLQKLEALESQARGT